MCGRFALRISPKQFTELFGVEDPPDLPPRYNIAPGQNIPAIRQPHGSPRRTLALLHWGLIPHWTGVEQKSSAFINARRESAAQKPAFRQPFRHRRCLIPALGFYEWLHRAKGKQPYFFHLPEHRPFAFAGLWDLWSPPGREPLETCAILTEPAAESLKAIHDRMPVILRAEHYGLWLNPAILDPAFLQTALDSSAGADLQCHPVSPAVNQTSLDSPRCIEKFSPPPDDQDTLFRE